MSKIVCVQTIRIAERPNLIWVEVETDDGLIGLGESFRGAQATEAVIHEQVAPWLIGRDARLIEAVSRHLTTPYLGFHSAGAEIRAASAIDIALWDIAGKRHGIPVHEALGGAVQSEIRAYNTCAGYAYNTSGVARQAVGAGENAMGPYDDQIAFTRDAGALAESLLSEGFTAMKIWPFDIYAEASGGQLITLPDLKAGHGAWLPGYFEIERHMSIRSTGYVAAIPFALSIFGAAGGGWWADWLMAKGYSAVNSRKIPLVTGVTGAAV